MALYSQSVLDEIRDRLSIVSYIGEHIPLKKSGRNHKGICPFHGEKTPSFMVSDEKGIFHCFGCGEGGDIFKFVMKYDNVSFPEAVEQLAARTGVALPKRSVSKEELSEIELAAKKKKLLLRVNKIAAEYFRRILLDGEKGAPARNYLKNRGILNEISTQHFLGYADDYWEGLAGYLKAKNVPQDLATELGLIKRRESGDGHYDFFRSRLIFPIVSPRLEVVGFGGRVISADEKDAAKYINSADSAVYHKSYSVYGLNVAQKSIRELDQVIIVEGYMDVLSLNQHGMMNVVAPLGTAITAAHVKLLMRYSRNMVLVFDGDDAGIRAAERSLAGFMEAQAMPNVVVLPGGRDPDEWVRENGREPFEELVRSAESLLGWLIKRRAAFSGGDIGKKKAALAELAPYFARLGSTVEKAHFRKLLADEFRVDEGDLMAAFSGGATPREAKAGAEAATGRLKVERMLLALVLADPEGCAGREICPSLFTDESYRTIFAMVSEGGGNRTGAGRLMDRITDEEVLRDLRAFTVGDDAVGGSAENMLDDCIRYLTRSNLAERLRVITEEIKRAEKENDVEAVSRLIAEKNLLLAEKKAALGAV